MGLVVNQLLLLDIIHIQLSIIIKDLLVETIKNELIKDYDKYSSIKEENIINIVCI